MALLQLDEGTRRLFRDFQSNLLSLVNHELRTPLMGIMNSLSLLEAPAGSSDFSNEELVSMARRNAQRLHETLSSLLDLASIESGNFHAQLREVDLGRLTGHRLQQNAGALKDVRLEVGIESNEKALMCLADPLKLGRAIDLVLQALLKRCEPQAGLRIQVSPRRVRFDAELMKGFESAWAQAWSQALAGFQGGIASPFSAFADTLRSEKDFLSRTEEGLGSEFMLVHEIMRLHQGSFSARLRERKVELELEFPEMDEREALRLILSSRVSRVEPGITPGSIALALLQTPPGKSAQEFCGLVREQLFRGSDSAYPYSPGTQGEARVAVLLEDCKREDAPRLIARLEFSLGLGMGLKTGWVTSPEDGLEAGRLLELAEKRLRDALARDR